MSQSWYHHYSRDCQTDQIQTSITFKARDKSTMLTLFKSLVLIRLEYGCQLWCPATVNQMRAMESIQRKFTKHIDGLYSLSYKERLIGLHMYDNDMYSLQRRREGMQYPEYAACSHLCVENTGRYGSNPIPTDSREPLGKKKPHVCAELS